MAPNGTEKRPHSVEALSDDDEKELSDLEIAEIVAKRRLFYSGDVRAQFKAGAAVWKAKKIDKLKAAAHKNNLFDLEIIQKRRFVYSDGLHGIVSRGFGPSKASKFQTYCICQRPWNEHEGRDMQFLKCPVCEFLDIGRKKLY